MATQFEHPLSIGTPDQSSNGSPQMSINASSGAMMTPGMQSELKEEEVSPSSSNGQLPTPAGNASRRPPRKSTLTQQQKNQKRQRATQEQLATLEVEFNKNPTPTAQVRDRIAEEINMTERSVQIWFQNRRAKIKMMAKKSLETGEDIDLIPESMRAYLAVQAMETGKGLGGSYLGRTGLMPFGQGNLLMGGDQNGQSKVLIHHLTCRSLSIGKWTRVGQNTMDLIIFYSPDKCTMTYYINNEQAGYKIEYPFSHIKNIFLDNNEADPCRGGIVIELNRPPHFFMDSSPSTNGFYQCGDFTEDLQASQCLVHHLGGTPKVLSGQLAKLVSLESFATRHATQNYVDAHAVSMSAPVSPILRPASQPSFPPPQMSMVQEQWGMNNLHSAQFRPQGHKRQRSRSVPGPVDFAMFQNQSMPSFYIQAPGDMGPPPPQHSHIYAPVPQQPQAPGPHLRIDTQAGFGLDMRQYPLSVGATTPSDFPQSPGIFSSTGDVSGLPGSQYGTPFHNGGFLSPMPLGEAGNAAGTNSPLSYATGVEPAIAEQSPPVLSIPRSASADIYGGNDGSCAVSDDGMIGDMYSKHALGMPMHHHSPGFAQAHGHSSLQTELDLESLVHFDSLDPSSLSPETLAHVPQ